MDEKEREKLLKKIEYYTKKIEEDPNNISYFFTRGNTFYDLKEHDKAIENYNKVIELDPKHSFAYNNRGNAFYGLKEYNKAIKDYDKAIELDPNYTLAYNNRGIAYKNLGNYDKAIKDYDKAIELDPNYTLAYNNRGNAFHGLKEYNKAIKDYDKAIELDPNYTLAYNNRGNAFHGLKEYNKAIKDYDKAIELDPNYTLAYNNRGNAFYGLKEYNKAIKDYDKAIELDPNYTLAYNNRGNAFHGLKEYNKAIKDYDKAIELDPNYTLAYNNRGIAYKNLDNYDKAIKDYDKAIELDPNYTLAYNNRGIAYKNLGNYDKAIKDYDKAIKDYDKAIELDPNYTLAYNNKEFVDKILKNNKSKDLKEKIQQDSEIFGNIENYEKTPALNENEEIQESTENKFSMEDSKNNSSKGLEEGYLIFADILGWKGIWKKYNLNEERIRIATKLLDIRDILKKEIKEENSSINLISDTFIVSSNNYEMSNKISKRLIEECLKNSFVIRGTISFGEYYNKDTVYIGPAVDEAASWHDVGEEIGIFYAPSARLSIKLKDNELKECHLINDEVFIKNRKIKTYFINWYSEENKKNFYNIMRNQIITPDISSKYFNTEEKLNKYVKDNIKEKEEMLRIGNGYDVHKLVKGRKLMLGGVEIPHTKGVLGHSDGDVLLHAITDAIIGALGLGDIGLHFPDNDENLKDINSAILLKKINNIMKEKNYKIVNLDTIIVIQKPKLRPYIDSIRDNIAKILEIDSELINVKAKTEEKLGFTGDESGVKSYCVVLLEKEIELSINI
ncbi:2-C-methyl-D-erythritol 2,4-cyclodiphosphate synthase [Fusobacterium animalis]